MGMKNPVHPGAILREDFLVFQGITVTAAAAHLGVSRQALSNLVNEKASMSPEMAIRLSKAFGLPTAMWMGLQARYDLARARRLEPTIKVKRYRAPAKKTTRRKTGD